MFHLEDEMFELDVMIETMEAVLRILEPLDSELQKMNMQERYK